VNSGDLGPSTHCTSAGAAPTLTLVNGWGDNHPLASRRSVAGEDRSALNFRTQSRSHDRGRSKSGRLALGLVVSFLVAMPATPPANASSGTFTSTASTEPAPSQPPSAPDGLTATPDGPQKIDLRWNAATDDHAVVHYGVYRGGRLIGSTNGATRSFVDRTVVASTSYSYTVDAVDRQGLRSAKAAPASATTPAKADTKPPTTPSKPRATVTSTTRVDVSWSPSSDNVGVAGYTVYRGGNVMATVGPAVTAFADTTVSAGNSYTYSIDAFDAAGNRSAKSSPAVAVISSDPVIAAAGDIACDPNDPNFNGNRGVPNYCQEIATSNILGSISGLSGVLALGDLQYEDAATPAEWAASYDPSWGRFRGITHPVIGNHEYYSGSPSTYFSYWGSGAGQPNQGWYSFDIGNWHIVVLSGECAWIGGCQSGSPEENWLRADLAASSRPCTIAAWHEPRFTSGWSGPQSKYDALWRDLYARGAEIVLNAHDHVYERFAPQNPDGQADAKGIREFIVGTGGKNHSSFPTLAANSQVRNSDTFGVLRLTLHSNSYDWKFLPEPGKVFTDSGTGTCSPVK
jgi:acid phosphatase type 7